MVFQEDSLQAQSTFGKTDRVTTPLLDSRATTPLCRWPPHELSALGLLDSRSSRTPTPLQWSRGEGLRSQTPNTACISGCTKPLAEAAALELHSRASTAIGHFSASRASTPLTARELRSHTFTPQPEGKEVRWKETKSTDDEVFASIDERQVEKEAEYEVLFRQPMPSKAEIDDFRPMRSRPAPPGRLCVAGPVDPADQLMLSFGQSTGSRAQASLAYRKPYGGKLRELRRPTSEPAKLAAPVVRPHNAWCTFIEWVEPADGDDDESFSYELRCRTDAFDTCLLLTDLGNEPRAQMNGLEAGITYYFQVRGRNEIGVSAWSEWSLGYNVLPPLYPVPRDASGNEHEPKSSSDEPNSAKLEWDEPCSHGAPVLGYIVQYGLNPHDPNTIETVTSLSRRCEMIVTNLQPNNMYFFRVKAMNQVGDSDWTDWSEGVATKAVKPDIPEPDFLKADSREMTIHWPRPFTNGFRIDRYDVSIACEDPEMHSAIFVKGEHHIKDEPPCEFRLTDLKPLHEYYFKVRAVSSIGPSEWSRTVGPFKTLSAVPGKCKDVRVVSNEVGNVTLEFRSPDAFRLPISHFLVRYSEDFTMRTTLGRKKVPREEDTPVGTLISCKITGLPPGLKLYFQVAAVSQAGKGEFTENSAFSEVLTAPDLPLRPDPPKAEFSTGSSILVSVQDVTRDNGSPITQYELRWDTSRDMNNAVVAQGPMKLAKKKDMDSPCTYEYAVTGLEQRGPYYFSVRAVNKCGPSPWSESSDPQILQVGNPARMSSPTLVEADSPSSLILAYVPSADLGMKMGGRILEYEFRFTRWPELLQDPEAGEIDFGHDGAPKYKVRIHRWEAPPHGVPPPVRATGLMTGRSYVFQVRAISKFGEGPWSDTSPPFRTLPSAPEKPDGVDTSQGTTSPFSCNLALPLSESNGSPIKACRLQFLGPNWKNRPEVTEWKDLKLVEFEDCEIQRVPRQGEDAEHFTDPCVTIWEYTVLHLEPGAAYRFKFSCINDIGESPFSEISGVVTTKPTIPEKCTPPYVACSEDQTSDSLRLHWDPPHDGGSDIRCYTLLWSANARFLAYKTVENITEATYLLTDLSPNQKYYAKVSATNVTGPGKFSDLMLQKGLGVFTTSPRPPAAPQNVKAAVIEETAGAAVVTWDRPHDDGGCTVSRYKVLVSEHADLFGAKEVIQKAYRECQLTELQPDTVYYFTVKAVNSAGTGPAAEGIATVRTLPISPQKFLPPARPQPPTLEIKPDPKTGLIVLQASWDCPEKYDKKLGFICDQKKQTHMITHYSVRMQGGYPNPEVGEHEEEIPNIEQVRDRRTVPKNQYNVARFGDLVAGRYYHVFVKAFNLAGESDWSDASEIVRAPPGIPDAISSIECISTTQTSLQVSWQSPSGNGEVVTHFILRWREERILRGWNMGNPSGPGESDASVGQYEDVGTWSKEERIDVETAFGTKSVSKRSSLLGGTSCKKVIVGLQPASFYSVEIKAANVVGDGAVRLSGSIKTQSTLPGPPGPAIGLPGQSTTSTVSFKWQAPQYTGGEDILGYEVRWIPIEQGGDLDAVKKQFASDDVGTKITLQNLDTTCTVEGIHPGDSILPVLRCWNSVGYSAWTLPPQTHQELEAFSAMPDIPQELVIPPLLEQSPSDDYRPFSMQVTWECPDGMGRAVQSFTMRLYRDDIDSPVHDEDSSLGKAKDELHEFVIVKPKDRNWVTGEKISIGHLHKDLTPGMPYVAYVRATSQVGDAKGWGPKSLPLNAPPELPCKPAPPTSLWQWPHAIEVIWAEPYMQGAKLECIEVRYSNSSNFSDYVEVDPELCNQDLENNREITVDDLTFSTCYWFKIRVKNIVGWSEWSDISLPYLTGACRPAPPDVPRLVDIDMESVQFSWSPPDNHGAVVTKYDAFIVEPEHVCQIKKLIEDLHHTESEEDRMAMLEALPVKAFVTLQADELDREAPDHLFQELLGGLEYALAVRAHNKEGPSDWSEPLLGLRTPSAAPVEAPPPVLIEATQDTLKVNFQLPYDNGDPITGATVAWFRVSGPMDRHIALGGVLPSGWCSANQAGEGSVQVDVPPHITRAKPNSIGGTHEALIEGLEPGTEYDVQVCSTNSYGEGAYSIAVRMICLPGKPDAPGRMRHVNPNQAKGTDEVTKSMKSPATKDVADAPSKGALEFIDEEDPNFGEEDSAELAEVPEDDIYPEVKDASSSSAAVGDGAIFWRRTSQLRQDEVISVQAIQKKRDTIFKKLGFVSGRSSSRIMPAG